MSLKSIDLILGKIKETVKVLFFSCSDYSKVGILSNK